MKKPVSILLLCVGLSGAIALGQEARQPPQKRYAYISNLMSHTVSVIDLDTQTWLRDLNVGRYPIFSSLHPHDSTKLIVALHNYDRREDEDGIVLLDLLKEKVIKRVAFPGPGMPSGFVYDSRRDRIYIADENLHRVFVLDGTTLDLISELPAGLIPVHVALSPDNRWLVATNRKSADLYVYDLDNILRDAKEGIGSIHLGPSPQCSWDPDESGSKAFSHPVDVKFGSEPDICYVTDFNTRELLFVDIRKGEVLSRLALSKTPFDFALNRNRTLAFVCHVDGDSISVVDLGKRKIVAEIPGLVSNPIHCELDEESNRLFVACWGGAQAGGIYIVDVKTYHVLKHIALEGAKASIGIAMTRLP